MSEITKLYENAGVLKECLSPCYINKTWRKTHDCPNCDNREKYPLFTAEKEIELIKFLLKNYEGVDISKKINRFNFLVDNATFAGCHHNDKSFEESLAGVINKLWADMSEEEKQQIKEILE